MNLGYSTKLKLRVIHSIFKSFNQTKPGYIHYEYLISLLVRSAHNFFCTGLILMFVIKIFFKLAVLIFFLDNFGHVEFKKCNSKFLVRSFLKLSGITWKKSLNMLKLKNISRFYTQIFCRRSGNVLEEERSLRKKSIFENYFSKSWLYLISRSIL